MADKVKVQVTIELDRDEFWSRIWGADPWAFGSWWGPGSAYEGDTDWNKAGTVTVRMEDPNEPEGSGKYVTKTIGVDDLLAAVAKCPPHIVTDLIEDNMDSISSDYIVQVAVYGDCIYG